VCAGAANLPPSPPLAQFCHSTRPELQSLNGGGGIDFVTR